MALLDNLKALEAFSELPRGRKALVIFSEGREYWPHYRAILRPLLMEQRCPFIYLASTADDPGLQIVHPLVTTINIGQGGARVNLFKNLEADVMVLTMPDLAQLSLARSPHCGEYVYVFHSPVSTHMVYQEGAFDYYDTIFCTGPHHETEIRRREQMAGLPAKRLFQHGYGRLDELMSAASTHACGAREPRSRLRALLAPSWGPTGILETRGREVVQTLLDAGYQVIVRPHPQTMRLARPALDELVAAFDGDDRFEFETDMAKSGSFFESDLLISDWSGAAFDFAFTRLKPVIFIDTPRKINNQNWQSLDIEPVEAELRDRIGIVVPPGDNAALKAAAELVLARCAEFRQNILAERQRLIFNPGNSGQVAARELARLAFDASLGDEGQPEALETRCAAVARTALGATGATVGVGSLTGLLSNLLESSFQISPEVIPTLDALCRRIDVFKSVHRDYDPEFRTPAPNSPNADAPTLLALVYVLIGMSRNVGKADRDRALKLLNSAGWVLTSYSAAGNEIGVAAFESLLARALDAAVEAAP